jgi:serine/threonine-protein kinase
VTQFLMMHRGILCTIVTRSGLILDDRYRLDERIAAGGVGQVWRATDLLLQRPVAVKVLRPEYSDHPETLDRFRKEARHAGAINNAHVAQVHDYGHSGPEGSPYLVMEFVDGPSLADLLAVDPLEPVRALDIIAQAADGLSAAHKVGLVHRDVKPGNILISREGQVKVTDFGIAHAAGQVPVTGPGLVMGTTQYMAPERIAGNQGTAASDVYALGIVLHECLTGVPPHDGTPAEVMAAHLYLPLPPLPVGTPLEIEDLVARLTVKDPARRISDARELADLAAMIRDSLSGVPHVPAVRTGAHSASGAIYTGAVAVPQVGAIAGEPVAPPSGGSGLDSPAVAHAAAYGTDADYWGHGSGSTAVLPPPGGSAHTQLSDEWNVPPRMSLPTEAGQPKPPQRRKATAIALGAGVLGSAGLVAVLVSGAFTGSPAANQQPGSTPATGIPTVGRMTFPTSSTGTARATQPAGGATSPAGAANPGSSAGTTPSKKPSTKSSAHPSSTASTGTTSGTSPSNTPSSTPSSSGPSDTPTTPSGSTPTPSPSKSGCLLGICL